MGIVPRGPLHLTCHIALVMLGVLLLLLLLLLLQAQFSAMWQVR